MTKKYRKTSLIEAEQFVDYNKVPYGVEVVEDFVLNKKAYFIRTLEGVMTVSLGDWVARGVKGEYWPIKPDIFAETYEEVV
jgi:hypothetical protein